jgi:hypothetical protein
MTISKSTPVRYVSPDWTVTAPQRTLFKTRLALIAVALVVIGLATGLHRLIQ